MGDKLPALSFGGRRVVDVTVGAFAACASTDDQTVWCWNSSPPQMVAGPPGPHVKALAAVDTAVVALYDDGTVSPLLPLGKDPVFTSNYKVVAITGAYGGRTCALLDDGTVACPPSQTKPPRTVVLTQAVRERRGSPSLPLLSGAGHTTDTRISAGACSFFGGAV